MFGGRGRGRGCVRLYVRREREREDVRSHRIRERERERVVHVHMDVPSDNSSTRPVHCPRSGKMRRCGGDMVIFLFRISTVVLTAAPCRRGGEEPSELGCAVKTKG
jgi:hypothetical protein